MRAKDLGDMIAVGAGTYVRPDDIECVAPFCGDVPSGNGVIDATGGRQARTAIHLRSGKTVYSFLSIQSIFGRLARKKKTRPEAGSGGILAQQELFGDCLLDGLE